MPKHLLASSLLQPPANPPSIRVVWGSLEAGQFLKWLGFHAPDHLAPSQIDYGSMAYSSLVSEEAYEFSKTPDSKLLTQLYINELKNKQSHHGDTGPTQILWFRRDENAVDR